MRQRVSPTVMLVAGAVALLATIFLAPAVGSTSIPWKHWWFLKAGMGSTEQTIILKLRLPRVLLAVMVGGTLSVAGAVLQALLRNPLATPYTLGISSGGALGAVLALKLGLVVSWWGFGSVQLAAFAGSLITILLVYTIAQRWLQFSIYALILMGVSLSFFFSAIILLVHYLADFTQTQQMIRWMMGGLEIIGYQQLGRTFPVILVLVYYLWRLAVPLNLISFSPTIALSKGVDVSRVQKQTFVAASLLTGTVIALSGPIGFVGLVVPHGIRLLMGPDLRNVIPAAFLIGAVFLGWADTLARTMLAPINLPVGIITALIGGPIFLALLLRNPFHSREE